MWKNVRWTSWVIAWLGCAILAYVLHENLEYGVGLYYVALLALVAVIVPVIGVYWFVGWAKEIRPRQRERDGLCVRCGYDIRHCESRCSECGMPIWQDRDPLTGKPLPRNAKSAAEG